jgi:hypothetical protein
MLKSRSARDRRHNGPLSQFEIFSLAIDIQLMRSCCGGVEDDLHRRSRDVTDISKRSELFQSGFNADSCGVRAHQFLSLVCRCLCVVCANQKAMIETSYRQQTVWDAFELRQTKQNKASRREKKPDRLKNSHRVWRSNEKCSGENLWGSTRGSQQQFTNFPHLFNQVQSISSKKPQAMTTKGPLLINSLTNVVKGDCRLVFVDGDN